MRQSAKDARTYPTNDNIEFFYHSLLKIKINGFFIIDVHFSIHNHVCIKCLVCKFLFFCKNRNKYMTTILISVSFVKMSHNYLLNMSEPKKCDYLVVVY